MLTLFFINFTNRNSGPIDSTSVVIRITWKAVTIGTPSCRFLAVSDISAIPPGEVARIAVAGWMPDQAASNKPKPAATTIAVMLHRATPAR